MLTEIAKKRYKKMMDFIDKNGLDSVTRVDLAKLWGISPDMATNVIAMFVSDGLDVPKIARVPRQRNGGYNKRVMVVDKANLGDETLPVCPRCEAAGRYGLVVEIVDGKKQRVKKKVHLTHEDGETFCLECGYDPLYQAYKKTTYRLSRYFSRRRETERVAC